MRIQVSDSIEIQIDGKKVATDVQVVFDGDTSTDVQAVLRRVGSALGAPSRAEAPVAESAAGKPGPDATAKPALRWKKPDLHAKAMKSVHRVVRAISDAGGKGLTVAEIVKKARISNVPTYKMLKPDHAQGKYAARFLRTTKVGRELVVDLTPEGRQLASLIRAGQVPS